MSTGSGKKKHGKLIWIGGGIGVVVLIGAGLVGYIRSHGAQIEAGKLAKVERGDLARSVVATGKIQPITKVEIKSKASGIVKKLYVDAGEHVHAGQILAELDKDEMQAQVRSAEAQLASAEATLRSTEADLRRAEVDASGVDVPTLKRAYDRAKVMQKDGVISQAAFDDAERNFVTADNKQASAKASVAVGRARIKQSEADVRRAKASLQQLREQLSYTTITAPIDGIILSRDVEIGDAVSSILVMGSAATLVMTVGDTTEVYVKGKVDESDVGKIYLGQQARIKIESFKDKGFFGKVTKISPMGVEKDNVTTFEVRVSINNPGGELKAMMTANAEIILEEHKGVLTIPEAAILYDANRKASVEVPQKGAPGGKTKVEIQTGISNGARTEVLAGLKQGDQVVLQ